MHRLAPVIVVFCLVAFPQEAAALITGGEGNSPISDPGWPKGAAVIFNTRARIAWWERPPFGGGQWHAECRGDSVALNAVLQDFAKLDVKSKRIVVHDGIGHSFWLAPNHEPAKLAAARMDWVFMVWQAENWQRLRKLPADLNPTDQQDSGPPSQIDVFTGSIRWADVIVPKGIEVIDQRLEGHGFTAADGAVLEGTVVDLATKQAVSAKIRLERIEPQQKGGYRYTVVAEAPSNRDGHWVLKKTPPGWYRVVIHAPGFAPGSRGTFGLTSSRSGKPLVADSLGHQPFREESPTNREHLWPMSRYDCTTSFQLPVDAMNHRRNTRARPTAKDASRLKMSQREWHRFGYTNPASAGRAWENPLRHRTTEYSCACSERPGCTLPLISRTRSGRRSIS